ncbi:MULTISPECIES: YibE/F family protein [unclassified Pseudonocardia]|uniref:YibE/F family protein n=1 Tax=unclassified Pseudonocardia TaxID=2619320 RepID=UPI002016035C|nr:YibE/F family protein [Pseudonocardia sp. Ae707_Ps1]
MHPDDPGPRHPYPGDPRGGQPSGRRRRPEPGDGHGHGVPRPRATPPVPGRPGPGGPPPERAGRRPDAPWAPGAEGAGQEHGGGYATGPVPAGAPTGTGRRAARRRAEEDHAGTGHGHGHGHGAPSPAGRRVRNLLVALLVPCALATLTGLVLLWPGPVPAPELPPTEQVHGDVQSVQVADCSPGSGDGACTGVTVRMTDGPRAGRDLVQLVPTEPSSPRFAVGDPVTMAWSGGNPDEAGSYQLNDFQRGPALGWLAAAFAVAVVLLGRLRGFAALVGLLLSFAVLLWFVLPAILSGGSPLAVAVTGSCLIMFVVLYLTHGFSARTSCAVLGTLASLALIGVLGYAFTAATRLTGLDDTTANLIGTLGPGVPIDPRGLVLAGLVIGALGALDDVTVTQASAVWELGAANPRLGPRELFAAGMRIGRDHVASAVNTLVLAYAGAALPLLLLFSVAAGGVTEVLTSQDVATEIVRTLVGSIGLVAAVPVTTGLAALVAARR